jgi:hypothetical protein
MELENILIIGGALLLLGAIIFAIGFVPTYIYRKKEIKAFGEMASRFNFEAKLGKAGLKPNFPLIKGYFKKRWFFVLKVRDSKYTFINNKKFRIYTLRIATKLKNPVITGLHLQCSKPISNEVSVSEFGKYFNVEIIPPTQADIILTDEIKKKMLETGVSTGMYYVSYDNGQLFTSNDHALYNSKDVEKCSIRLELLHEIAEKADAEK